MYQQLIYVFVSIHTHGCMSICTYAPITDICICIYTYAWIGYMSIYTCRRVRPRDLPALGVLHPRGRHGLCHGRATVGSVDLGLTFLRHRVLHGLVADVVILLSVGVGVHVLVVRHLRHFRKLLRLLRRLLLRLLLCEHGRLRAIARRTHCGLRCERRAQSDLPIPALV